MKTKITIGKIVIEIETDEEETTAPQPTFQIIDKRIERPEQEPEEKGTGNGAHIAALSAREQRILELLGEGMSNKMIALRLCCTESTIKVHMKAILRKLQCKNRTQAALAHQNGVAA